MKAKFCDFTQCFDMESPVSDGCSCPKKLQVLRVLYLVVSEERHGRTGDRVGQDTAPQQGTAPRH